MRPTRRLTTILSAGSAALLVAALPMPASADTPPTEVKPGAECGTANYFESTDKWEISWGHQYTYAGVAQWTSADYGGLVYIDPGTLKTPEEELEGIREFDEDKTTRNSHYHWWYVSRDMVNNGATTVLEFEEGVTVTGEVAVGTDGCPSVKWTFTEVNTPGTFPAPVDPAPAGSLSFLGSLGS